MDYSLARKHMVESQLRPNRITDKRLLAAFANVQRELFVDSASRNLAYCDDLVDVGQGRRMFSPMVAAHLLQSLDIDDNDKVLVVAAGTGYSALIAAQLSLRVFALEENLYLQDIARKALLDMGCRNVAMVAGKPQAGLLKEAPFDKILIDVPVGEIPSALVEQLKPGGRMAAVVRNTAGLMEATVFTRQGQTLFEQGLFETKGDIAPGFAPAERFVF